MGTATPDQLRGIARELMMLCVWLLAGVLLGGAKGQGGGSQGGGVVVGDPALTPSAGLFWPPYRGPDQGYWASCAGVYTNHRRCSDNNLNLQYIKLGFRPAAQSLNRLR